MSCKQIYYNGAKIVCQELSKFKIFCFGGKTVMGKLSRVYSFNLLNEVTQNVGEIIHYHFPKHILAVLGCNEIDLLNLCNDAIQDGLLDDLNRFASSDPAAKDDAKYVLSAYKGFKAMIFHRVAHAVLTWYVYQESDKEVQQYLRLIAREISEEGKVETGVDIHPAAQIGSGCIIDHGVGTKISGIDYEGQTVVIGETVIIGRNCTILNDVVIGSSDVNEGQKEGRRQPKIGNNVTICAGARLYGKIDIGDNVWIGAKCIVHQDIPSYTKITMENQYQISKNIENGESIIEIDGLIKEDEGMYILGGIGIEEIELCVIDENYNEIDGFEIVILGRKKGLIRFCVKKVKDIESKRVMLKIITRDKQWHYYFSKLLIRDLLKRNA